MKRLRSALTRRFRDYGRDERGTILVEFILFLPLLIWAYMGMIVYFDAFRILNELGKATFTVGDLVSRQQDKVDPNFLDRMADVVAFTTRAGDRVSLRFTSIDFDPGTNKPKVNWSHSPANKKPALTTAGLDAFTDKIPAMDVTDSLLIVESWLDYTPLANGFYIGISPQTYSIFEPYEPRYLDRICLTTVAGCNNLFN